MAAEKLPIEVACGVLGVSVSGYYTWLNRQRRHTSLGMLTPIEFEARHQHKPAA